MNYKISATGKFDKELKRLVRKFPALKSEYAALIELLETDPLQGIPIRHNCYKIRLAIASKGTGKSGGARVVTYVHIIGEAVYLLTIYDKSEEDNVSDNDLHEMLKNIWVINQPLNP